MSFVPGQRVVCIDAEWHDSHPVELLCPLRRGTVYTVIKYGEGLVTYRGISRRPIVYLAEVENPYFALGWSSGFVSERFRPVDETKIEIFRQILVSPPKEVEPA